MNIIVTRSRQSWNKGKLAGQPPAPTERYLGHSSKASNCRKNSGSGSLRSSHRQQASRARRRPWRARIITSRCDAAEDETASAVRYY